MVSRELSVSLEDNHIFSHAFRACQRVAGVKPLLQEYHTILYTPVGYGMTIEGAHFDPHILTVTSQMISFCYKIVCIRRT